MAYENEELMQKLVRMGMMARHMDAHHGGFESRFGGFAEGEGAETGEFRGSRDGFGGPHGFHGHRAPFAPGDPRGFQGPHDSGDPRGFHGPNGHQGPHGDAAPHGFDGQRGPRGFRGGRGFDGPDGARHGQDRVLAMLSLKEGISQKDLAFLLGIRPQSLSEMLAKLEESQLIERRKSPEDGRVTQVYLTDAGRERAQLVAQRRKQASADILSVLTDDEKQQLGAILDKLEAALARARDGMAEGQRVEA